VDTNEHRSGSAGRTSSQDTVLVQFVAKGLPKDSPEFQARAKLPLSQRGPNLALYREQRKAEAEGGQPPNG
jgi:hypothetical protein